MVFDVWFPNFRRNTQILHNKSIQWAFLSLPHHHQLKLAHVSITAKLHMRHHTLTYVSQFVLVINTEFARAFHLIQNQHSIDLMAEKWSNAVKWIKCSMYGHLNMCGLYDFNKMKLLHSIYWVSSTSEPFVLKIVWDWNLIMNSVQFYEIDCTLIGAYFYSHCLAITRLLWIFFFWYGGVSIVMTFIAYTHVSSCTFPNTLHEEKAMVLAKF